MKWKLFSQFDQSKLCSPNCFMSQHTKKIIIPICIALWGKHIGLLTVQSDSPGPRYQVINNTICTKFLLFKISHTFSNLNLPVIPNSTVVMPVFSGVESDSERLNHTPNCGFSKWGGAPHFAPSCYISECSIMNTLELYIAFEAKPM